MEKFATLLKAGVPVPNSPFSGSEVQAQGDDTSYQFADNFKNAKWFTKECG